jgi:hypothetical protein
MYDIQHILLIPHTACMRHDSVRFSQITMRRFKFTSVRLSLVQISTMMFPQCSERISIAETTHELHICILRISKFRHFCCCHCSCYRYYCPSLITALQLSVLPRTLSAEIRQNVTESDIDIKTLSLGNSGESERKKSYLHIPIQMMFPTISLSFY